LLSDCGYQSTGRQLDSMLSSISSKPVKYIINTHWHHDHSGGNIYFNREGTIISHVDTRNILTQDYKSTFWEEAYQAFPEVALPDVTFNNRMTLHFNNEEIELVYLQGGHSDGDIIVWFKNSNVVHMGDLLFSFGFPAIDFEHGGEVKRFADNLQRVIDMVPGDALIIAGHGPDFTIGQLIDYKNMILGTLHIIKKSMAEGSSMEEMKEKAILKNYETWAGGYFTCDEWIKIVYNSLIFKIKQTS